MNLKSCNCGVVLDFDSNIELHTDDERQTHYYICPVCKKEHEVYIC